LIGLLALELARLCYRSDRKEPSGCRWLFHDPCAAIEPHCRGRYLGPMNHPVEGDPRLRRPTLRGRDRARAWFVLRGSDCDDLHLVGALK